MNNNGEYGKRAESKSKLSAEGPTEHERLIRRLLTKATKAEASEWLREDSQRCRKTLGEFSDPHSASAFVSSLYRAGATQVFAVDIKADAEGDQHTGKLIVAMPKRPEARKTVFKWCKAQGKSLGFSPEQDGGEDYMFLLLD